MTFENVLTYWHTCSKGVPDLLRAWRRRAWS